jgi:hypothetical protein
MCRKCGFSPDCKSSSSAGSLVSIIRSILLGLVVFSVPSDSYSSSVHKSRSYSTRLFVKAIVIHDFADLTPAVDKFARLPTQGQHEVNYILSTKGPSPSGPEPFGLVADELQPLSDYVRELVVSENPVLTMAASHFFDKVT